MSAGKQHLQSSFSNFWMGPGCLEPCVTPHPLVCLAWLLLVCCSAQCMTWTTTWSSTVFTSPWQSRQPSQCRWDWLLSKRCFSVASVLEENVSVLFRWFQEGSLLLLDFYIYDNGKEGFYLDCKTLLVFVEVDMLCLGCWHCRSAWLQPLWAGVFCLNLGSSTLSNVGRAF